MVIGDKRKFLSCLVMIDHENVAKFAQDNVVPFSNFASLCRAREVQELIGGEIERANQKFARVETVKKFRLIEQLLDAEDEELTPTMKLKRAFVNKKYSDLIETCMSKPEELSLIHEGNTGCVIVCWRLSRPRVLERRRVSERPARRTRRAASRDTEIMLGMHTDLSGVTAIWGVNNSNAMRMRFDEINAKGGINGRKIHYIVEDNQYQVPRAVQAANKLINRDNIFLLLANAARR